MVSLTSSLPTLPIDNKRVILRVDYNVPIIDGKIPYDLRLKATLPTIDFLLARNAKIILLTHIGRPTHADPALSTRIFVSWFQSHGYSVDFAADLATAYTKSSNPQTPLLLVENLRFFPEEKAHDIPFAQELARLGDYYVNDAFALLHERDTSITLLAEQFPMQKRTIGFLIEKEIATLNTLMSTPGKPFVLIIGGNKAHEKITLLEDLLSSLTTVLLCPALVFSYLKRQGLTIGASVSDPASFNAWDSFITKAQKHHVTIVTPVDYVVAYKDQYGALSVKEASKLTQDDYGISIGPATVELYAQYITKAHTVFYNGLMGMLERPETLSATEKLFRAMTTAPFRVVGGGDSTSAVQAFKMEDAFTYLCSGGGAMIAYMAGEQLPGLQPFVNK